MLILVHGNGFELDPSLRSHVQSKIESSMSKFQNRIGTINAYLADLNGPKNGIDKSIRLVIDLQKKPVVVLDEKGGQWHTMLESISDRASHTISRLMSKSRQHRRAKKEE
jgi:putative sigma-54 modulation protein